MSSIAVVIPAYNSGPAFAANLVRFADYFAPYREAYDIRYIIVDDASTDDTLQVSRAFARYRSNVMVLEHSRRLGIGRALRTALRRICSDYTILVDGALTYCASAAMELVEALERNGADVAIASPYMRGAHASTVWWRNSYSLLANRTFSLMARGRYASFTCILRVYRTDFLKRLSFQADGARAIPELMFAAIRAGGRIIERPTRKHWHVAERGFCT